MRTLVFWVGLILALLASVFLAQVAWYALLVNPYSRTTFLTGILPLVIGAIIFLLIGLAMMRREEK